MILLSETSEFIQALIYGELSWLYLALFLGILFLIAWAIWQFCIVGVICCLFQAINYAYQTDNSPHIWKIIMLFVAMPLFLWRISEKAKE